MQQTPLQIGEYSFTTLLEPNEPDGYLVTCPALPGLVTEGDALDEAYAMAKDPVQACLASLIKYDEPIPNDKEKFNRCRKRFLPRHRKTRVGKRRLDDY